MTWKQTLLLAVVLSAAAVSFLPGCTSKKRTPELRVFIWNDYIDEDLIHEFEKQTGSKVLVDNYASDGELETKILTGSDDYDVIFPSDRSLAPLLRKDMLTALDRDKLPNWKHLDPKFLGTRHDAGNKYTAPYFWGTLAVGVNTDKIAGPVKGFEVLFDPKYKGQIVMLDDMEHDFAVALLHLGRPMNSKNKADLDAAGDLLVKQKDLVQAYTNDDYKDKLIKGEAAVALGWNGDLDQARQENAKIQVIVPESGTLLWVDSMAIPKNAPNPELAHKFINFMLDPEVAARNAAKKRYASPNKSALAKMDKDLLNDPAIYPPNVVLDRCQWIDDRGREIEQLERIWRKIRQ